MDEEIEVYPVFRALYTPVLFAGVPFVFFIAEILIGILATAFISLWLPIPILIIHLIASRFFKIDPYILPIALSLISKKGDKE